MPRWNNRRWPWWSELLIGILMLLVAALIGFISLANTIGLGKATGKVGISLTIVVWILAGVIAVIRGLNKM